MAGTEWKLTEKTESFRFLPGALLVGPSDTEGHGADGLLTRGTPAKLAPSNQEEVHSMANLLMTARRLATAGFLLGIISMTTACMVETREGYWDRDHHRYWHDH